MDKMAENNKGGILSSAKKNLIRRKTKVLQSLGKTGKTTDEILVEDCHKLDKQQEVANKFQKDLRHYIHSAKTLANACKQFYTTAAETYESEWENHEKVEEILKNMEVLWDDYLQKLNDQVQEPLAKYLACIPNIKARIAKRGRKMIDYDNAKHNLEGQQNAKKKDEAKIAKAQEDLDHAKKIYEDLNNELHQELPEFYNSRLGFYGNLYQSLFAAESVFFTESGKGCQQIASAGQKIAQENAEHTYTPRKNIRNTIIVGSDENLVNGHSDSGPDSPQPDSPSSPVPQAEKSLDNGTADDEIKPLQSTEEKPAEVTSAPVPAKRESIEAKSETAAVSQVEVKEKEPEPSPTEEPATAVQELVVTDKVEEKTEEVKMNGDLDSSLNSTDGEASETAPPPPPTTPPPEDDNLKEKSEEKPSMPAQLLENQNKDDDDDDDKDDTSPVNGPAGIDDEGLYQVPPPAKPVDDDYPPKYKYTVIATHMYKGEDDDELSFEAHELIYVLEFENPDEQKKIIEKKKTEQDPGWLMGMKKSSREVGVFPENFTKRVSEQSNNDQSTA